jgi:hypothetical protein
MMRNLTAFTAKIEKALETTPRLPHQAASLAFELFEVAVKFGLAKDPKLQRLIALFRERLSAWGFEDILTHQLKYAVKIAESKGPLLYEEMHKLFSLCGEIEALQWMGLQPDEAIERKFRAAVQERFSKQPKVARMTAEDNRKDWNRSFWWFASLLPTDEEIRDAP